MTDTYWHPKDPAWMAERKRQWLRVKQALDVLSARYPPFKRKFHKYHKELFFFGTLNPECRDPLLMDRPIDGFLATGHEAFNGALPLFKIWYHPEPKALDLEAMREEKLRSGSFATMGARFFNYWWGDISGCGERMYTPDEGMMGGREALCVQFLYPRLDYRDEIPVPDRGWSEPLCPHPGSVELWCQCHTQVELCRDARFVPYAPGQYLWEHMSYAVERYPELLFRERHGDTSTPVSTERRDWFLSAIAEVLAFEARTDASRRRPSTIALVERLMSKYDRKDFTPAMLALWDEAKQRVGELTERFRVYVHRESEDVARLCGLSAEEQAKRVSQWKQV